MIKILRLPGDCAVRLHDHAQTESRAYQELDRAIHLETPGSAPSNICPVVCDSSLVVELMDVAVRYSSEDAQAVSNAYVKAFR